MRSKTFTKAFLTAALLVTPTLQHILPRSFMRIVHRFPNPTWIENIAVRSNGDLLLTLLSTPELHSISPSGNAQTTPSLIHSFKDTPGITSLLGIAEVSPDVFAFVAGNASQPGSYSVWRADFGRTKYRSRRDSKNKATITKIADVPEAGLLNGMATLKPNIVLMADSMAGAVVRLDTQTGEHGVVISDASMKPRTTPSFSSGINGVKVVGSTLYFTNSFTGKLHRVEIDPETGSAVGSVETVASDLTDNDDFAVGGDGALYVVRDSYNVVEKVERDGRHRVFAGSVDSIGMAGPTAAAIGRGMGDANVLYVVTNGGIRAPVGGKTVGGNVVAVSL